MFVQEAISSLHACRRDTNFCVGRKVLPSCCTAILNCCCMLTLHVLLLSKMQTLERIPKMSANWYAEVIKKNRLES
jgi:hypothetical protein